MMAEGILNGDYHCKSPDHFGNMLVSRGWGHHPRGWLLTVDILMSSIFVLLQEAMTWMADRCVVK
jgi:hypothetical protein